MHMAFSAFLISVTVPFAASMAVPNCSSTRPLDVKLPETPGENDISITTFATLVFICIVGVTAGTDVTFETLLHVVRTQPRAFSAGIVCQFGVMPLFGFALSHFLPVKDAYCNESSLALAHLLPGFMPGGVTSNLMAMLVGGNIDLSIMMSFVSGSCAVFMIPLLLLVFYEPRFGNDSLAVVLPYSSLVTPLAIALVGVFIGIAVHKWAPTTVHRCVKHTGAIVSLLFLASAIAVALVPLLVSGLGSVTTSFLVTGLLYQPVGYIVGFLLAKFVFRLDLRNSLTVAIETGVQSWSLCIAIAAVAFNTPGSQRVLTDVLVNGALGPNTFYVFHCLWMLVLFRWINKKFGHMYGDSSDEPHVSTDCCKGDGDQGKTTGLPMKTADVQSATQGDADNI